MRPPDIESKYLTELSKNCFEHIEAFIDENVINEDNQTISYKGTGSIHYANQKLLITICRLLVAERNLKVYEIQSEILKGLKENFNG